MTTTLLKAASRGSRELSDAVLLATGWERSKFEKELFCPPLNHPARGKFKTGVLVWQPGPDPTRSLDDAVALTLEGHNAVILIGANGEGAATVNLDGIEEMPTDFYATPELALCIALLDAKESADG